MSQRVALSLCVFAAALAVAPQTLAGQVKGFVPGRTPDGQPDLRGMWVNFDSTPFEPAAPAAPATPPPVPGPAVNPPSHWTDHDSPMKAPRPSMVIDPPDGKVPVMKWAEDETRVRPRARGRSLGAPDAVGALYHARDSGGDVSGGL